MTGPVILLQVLFVLSSLGDDGMFAVSFEACCSWSFVACRGAIINRERRGEFEPMKEDSLGEVFFFRET